MHWHVCVDCEYFLQSLSTLICSGETIFELSWFCLHVLPPSHVSPRLASVSTFSSEVLTTVCHPLPGLRSSMQSPQVGGCKRWCSSAQSSCSLSSSTREAREAEAAGGESLANPGIVVVVVQPPTTMQHVPIRICPRTIGTTPKSSGKRRMSKLHKGRATWQACGGSGGGAIRLQEQGFFRRLRLQEEGKTTVKFAWR
jgi:hypothetical protein